MNTEKPAEPADQDGDPYHDPYHDPTIANQPKIDVTAPLLGWPGPNE